MASLRLISSMATRDVLAELASAFERATGQSVVAEAAGGVDVAKRVRAGEVFDVVVLASDVIDKLIGEGKLLTGSRVDVVQSGVAVAVQAGAPRPDISTEAAVREAVANASTLSYSTGPSGQYLERTFERWGLLETIRSRIVVPPPGTPVAKLVADGKAALGFQQYSEMLNRPGIDVLGPLPDAIQCTTVFSGGIASNAEGARRLLQFLAAPEAADTKRRFGLEPA